MAHIPYGYRIERGKAVSDPEQKEKLNVFLSLYLRGLSVEKARSASGIKLTKSALLDYMRAGTFAGTDYYPPIVPEEMREQIHAELEKRSHPGFSIIAPAIQSFTDFQMRAPEKALTGTAVEKAAQIYSLIVPVENGRRQITAKEAEKVSEAWQ